MMSETPNDNLLLPDRYPQTDIFICDVADAILKDDMASMEHPFFSLSKRPDTKLRRYENNNTWIEVVPSVKGLATIYDKDILIYCVSQIIAKMKDGVLPSRYVQIISKELLIFVNRNTGGKDYEALKEALGRLDGTRIRTNVKTGEIENHKGFGLIDSYEIHRSEKTGRIGEINIVLSEWVFNAIKAHEVLTLHKDYFRLRKPIERRVYEIARKHCGKQAKWSIGLALLKKKCGSRSSIKEFRRAIREMVKGGYLPDYEIDFDDERDQVIFKKRGSMPVEIKKKKHPTLEPETYNDARIVAPSYDVYFLEQEWRDWWIQSGEPDLKRPDKAFIAFCRTRYEKNPTP